MGTECYKRNNGTTPTAPRHRSSPRAVENINVHNQRSSYFVLREGETHVFLVTQVTPPTAAKKITAHKSEYHISSFSWAHFYCDLATPFLLSSVPLSCAGSIH